MKHTNLLKKLQICVITQLRVSMVHTHRTYGVRRTLCDPLATKGGVRW